jgi:lipopolysaccharide biosynthesis glycosyltransferase
MKQLKSPIIIFTVSDDHYAAMLGVLLKSIELNHASPEKIIFYIIEDQISFRNKQNISESIDNSKIEIVWIKMKNAIPDGLKLPNDNSSYPTSIYMRFFIPSLLPLDIEKVIYLDADTMALQDISNLWNTDLKDYPLAAVVDERVKSFDNEWGGIKNYKDFNFPPSTKYFNTGLLLLNLKVWRDKDIRSQLIDVIEKNKKFAQYPDQYALNVVLANQWIELDPRWNCFSTNTMKDAFLIHFVSRKPIYKTYDSNPEYYSHFHHYLNQTNWENFQLIGEFQRYLKKIKNVLLKKIFSG